MQRLRLRNIPAQVTLYLVRTRILRNSILAALLAGLFVSAPQTGLAQNVDTTTALIIMDQGGAGLPPAAISSIEVGNVAHLGALVMANGVQLTTGQVAFCDVTGGAPCRGTHVLGIAQLDSTGRARFPFRPPVGEHRYQAAFLGMVRGSTVYNRSASEQVPLFVVGNVPTTTTIVSSPRGSDPGPYALTAAISATGSRVPPSGDVTFYDQTRGITLATGSPDPATFSLGFVNTSNPEVGLNPSAVAAADFNADGIPDLVAANYESGTVTILQGDGSGGFTPTMTLYTGVNPFPHPASVATGDFDGNGLPDFAVTNRGERTVEIWLRSADGYFMPPLSPSHAPSPTGAGPVFIASGDLNGDGIADLATANSEDNTVTILLGNGDGTFAPPSSPSYTPPPTSGPQALAIADFTGDGIVDLAVANAQDNTVSILTGVGDGSFVRGLAVLATGRNPRSITVGDFNNDGKADLATANWNGGSVNILLGNGNGTFHNSPSSPVFPGIAPIAIAAGDVDGDGEADLVIANQYGNDPTGASPGSVTILRGRGDGTFTSYPSPLNTGYAPDSVALGDFNGDGFPDIAVLNLLGSGGDPLLNGTITILDPVITWTVESVATNVLPVGTVPQQVVANYDGDATFSPSASTPITLQAVPVASALTLNASLPSSAYGLDVILTATLAPWQGNGSDTNGEPFNINGEPVTFYADAGSGEIALGSALLYGDPLMPFGVAMATLKSSAMPAGTVNIRASYAGDSVLAAASATIPNYVVLPSVDTATALTITSGTPPSEVSSVVAGESVTLTATVLAGTTPVTTGQVDFCDATGAICTDLHRLGTAQLTAAGTATLRLRPSIGSHSYRAVFHPTFHAATLRSASNSAPVLLAVAPAVNERHPTVTTMSLEPGSAAGDYSFTATVVGTGIATLFPGGTVSLLDSDNGNALLGSGALNPLGIDLAFNTQEGPATGLRPLREVVGDFNGDAIPDIATVNYDDQTVTILLGNGDGTFAPPTAPSYWPPSTGSVPRSIAAGDFDGDGITDLATANLGNTVSILLGHGEGTFAPPSSPLYSPPATGSFPVAIAVGDFDRDGLADLAVANQSSYSVTILLGNGDGTFTPTPSSPATGPEPQSIVVGDFNNDGAADLATANQVLVQLAGEPLTILLGRGDGTFTSTSSSPVATWDPRSMATGDLNQDGNSDLAVTDLGGNNIAILLGNGDGTFAPPASPSYLPATGYRPSYVALSDLNGDGIADLAVTNSCGNSSACTQGNVTILLGNGDGTFHPNAISPNAGNYPWAIAAGDFNRDGSPDLFVVNALSNSTTVVLSSITATARATITHVNPIGRSIQHNAIASYEGDTNFAPSVSSAILLEGSKISTTLSLSANFPSSTYGQPVTLTATLSPSSASALSTDGQTVTFSNSGTPIGTAALSAGVATLDVSTLPAGTSDLQASYSGDADFTSASTAVLPHVVGQATPALSLNCYSGVFDGAPHGCTGAATGAVGEAVSGRWSFTPAEATNVGTTSVTGVFTSLDPNYANATAQGSIVITHATATIAMDNLQQTYTAAAVQPRATTTPAGLKVNFTFTLNGAAAEPIAAGDYDVTATVEDPNYHGTATGTFIIGRAAPVLSLNCYSGVFDGAPHGCSGAAVGVGGEAVSGEWSFAPASATNVGTTAVVGTFASLDSNYAGGTATGSIAIDHATSAVTVVAINDRVLVQNAATFTATVSSPAGAPTGAVSFLEGSTTLGTGMLSGGTATFTTSSLAAGLHSISARYGGDANFAASVSSAVTETVLDLTIDIPSTRSITVTRGTSESATLDLSILPSSGTVFPSDVRLTLTGLPGGVTATMISPAWAVQSNTIWLLPAGTAITGSTQIRLSASQSLAATSSTETTVGKTIASFAIAGFLLPWVGLCFAGKRAKRAIYTLLLAVISVGVIGFSGCGGGGTERLPAKPRPTTSTVNVTVSSGSLTRQTTFTLTVN